MNETQEFCKRLKFGDKDRPTIIYGVILEEDNNGFLIFKTGKRKYTVNRLAIVSIEDTYMPFKECNGGVV